MTTCKKCRDVYLLKHKYKSVNLVTYTTRYMDLEVSVLFDSVIPTSPLMPTNKKTNQTIIH